MKKLATLLTIGFLFFSSPLLAVSIAECEDKEGNRSFQKNCPPGYTEVGRKNIYVKGEPRGKPTADLPAAGLETDKSATLYMIPKCDTCDEVREFLQDNGVSVTEIDVSNDYQAQAEFEALAGELKVPVTVIDGKLIRGYSRAAFKAALEAGPSEPGPDSDADGGDQTPNIY